MRLVRDLIEDRIVYYWIDEKDSRLCKDLASKELAGEWRTRHMYDSYNGDNRRKSYIDRRRNDANREAMAKRFAAHRENPNGRRAADIPFLVDIDHVMTKLQVQ